MKNLEKQNSEKQIVKLRKLLHTLRIETRQEHEWQVLENDLFLQMEKVPEETNRINLLAGFNFTFKHLPGVFIKKRWVPSLITLLLVVLTCVWYYTVQLSPKPLVSSKILGVKGNPNIRDLNIEASQLMMVSEDHVAKVLNFDNHYFETDAQASVMMQFEPGTNIILAENSALTVEKANSREIKLFLHKGEILALVSKREKDQTFSVITTEASCKVIGTIFRVTAIPHGSEKCKTNLSVLEGKVEIKNSVQPKLKELVGTGQTIDVFDKTLGKPRVIAKNNLPIHTLSLLKLSREMIDHKGERKGLLDITSNPPGADIFIGETYMGKSPMAVNVTPGVYVLRLEQDGYTSWSETISIKTQCYSFISASLLKDSSTKRVVQLAESSTKTKKRNLKSLRKKTKRLSVRKRIVQKKIQKALETSDALSSKREEDNTKPGSKDFGFITNAAFVEALIQMSIGEHQKALIILDSLKNRPEISITEKIRIMSKISECYKGLGNFEKTLDKLVEKYQNTEDKHKKSNILWEIITVKTNCLADYAGAEEDILTYLKKYPRGSWKESAYAKLGEIQYITGKYSKAVGTFQYHINCSKSDIQVENSIYTIANIMRMDIKDYKMAVRWYTKLLEKYPQTSNYYGNSLFERAECYDLLNQPDKANQDYRKYLKLYPEGHLKAHCFARLAEVEKK